MSERSDPERAREDDSSRLTDGIDWFIETAGIEVAERVLELLRRWLPSSGADTTASSAPDAHGPSGNEPQRFIGLPSAITSDRGLVPR